MDNSIFVCGFQQFGQLACGNNAILKLQAITPPTNTVAISSGNQFSLFLSKEGTVWSCGASSDGSLGIPNVTNAQTASQISLPKIQTIATGSDHSLFLDVEGCVWACGDNSTGQLGLGPGLDGCKVPEKLVGLPPIQAISAADDYSVFLDEEGKVWSCGSNCYGQLGVGTISHNTTPVQIKNLPPIQSVNTGWYHTILVDEDGFVWTCGEGTYGALGNGSTAHQSVPFKIPNIPEVVVHRKFETKSARKVV